MVGTSIHEQVGVALLGVIVARDFRRPPALTAVPEIGFVQPVDKRCGDRRRKPGRVSFQCNRWQVGFFGDVAAAGTSFWLAFTDHSMKSSEGRLHTVSRRSWARYRWR